MPVPKPQPGHILNPNGLVKIYRQDRVVVGTGSKRVRKSLKNYCSVFWDLSDIGPGSVSQVFILHVTI